jgi:hypothetical protein
LIKAFPDAADSFTPRTAFERVGEFSDQERRERGGRGVRMTRPNTGTAVKLALGCFSVVVTIACLLFFFLNPPSVTRTASLSGQVQSGASSIVAKRFLVRGEVERAAGLIVVLTCEPAVLGSARTTVKATLRLTHGFASPDEAEERTMQLDEHVPDLRVMLPLTVPAPRGCLGSGCGFEATCQVVDALPGSKEIEMKWKVETHGTFRNPILPTLTRVGWLTLTAGSP